MDIKKLGVRDTSNTFATTRPAEGFSKTLAAFKTLADGQADYFMLMVYGGVGNGKTRCCEATVMALHSKGILVRRHRWCDVVRELKFRFGTTDYYHYFKRFREMDYMILDDVGSGSALGSWEWGELEDIVDYRREYHLPIIITTNLDIRQFPDRILSRFRDKTCARLILNEAGDYRPGKGVK